MGIDKARYEDLMDRLGVPNMDLDRFIQAFTHPNYLDPCDFELSYENLENLGDEAVTPFVRKFLLKEYREHFSYLWISRLVQFFATNKFFAWVAKANRLEGYILCRKGYVVKDKDCADIIEALIGAAFYDNAFDAAQQLVDVLVIKHLEPAIKTGIWDPVAFIEHVCAFEASELEYTDVTTEDATRIRIKMRAGEFTYIRDGETMRAAKVSAAGRVVKRRFGSIVPKRRKRGG